MSDVIKFMRTCLRRFEAALTMLVALLLLAPIAQAAMPADEVSDVMEAVLGEWEPPDMDAVISIRECGDALCADLVRHNYENVTITDINNPDPAMRERPLQGVRILDGLRRVKNDRWKDGRLYDPRTGKTYLSKLKILDRDHLKITGCIGPGLCKGYVWMRVGP
ncbi:MAG: DUF2147 domain-containing protein [Pseudomonadota bacterium]